jgi:hypothetical protein
VTNRPYVPDENEDTDFSAGVYDDKQEELNVYLVYTVNGGAEDSISMRRTEGTEYVCTMPGSIYGSGDVVRYQIRAADNGGTVSMAYWKGFIVGDAGISMVRETDENGLPLYSRLYVRLSGVVSAPVRHFGNIPTYTSLQTGEGRGIFVISYDSLMNASEGDSITVTGSVDQNYGQLSLKFAEYAVLKNGAGTPAPKELILADFADDPDSSEFHEGGLILIKNLKIVGGIENWGEGDQNFTVTDDDSVTLAEMRIVEQMGIWEDSLEVENKLLNVYCVIGQHDETLPYTEGYRLLPVKIEVVTAIDEENANLPEKFAVSQNYPNPFNPTTTIEFYLKTAGKVTFSVYSVAGRKVYEKTARYNAGKNSLTFDASRLASGIYFYRIKAGAKSMVKKMVLMK